MTRSTWLAMAGVGLAALSGVAGAQYAGSPWGARKAATCPSVRQVPSAAIAGQLVRCAKETQSMSTGESWLVEDLRVEVGGPTRFAAMYNAVTMPDADTRKSVYPIRGSWTWSVCKLRADAKIYGDPNLNCRETPVTRATGACWQTTFGDWKCTMNGTSGDTRSPVRPR